MTDFFHLRLKFNNTPFYFSYTTNFISYDSVSLLIKYKKNVSWKKNGIKKEVHFYTIAELKFDCTYVRILEIILKSIKG